MFVAVNGTRLYVDIEGAGLVPDGPKMRARPTLVLLHGGPGADHSMFKPAFSVLSDVAQIVYVDHRGNGRSVCTDRSTWNLAQWGEDVKVLCDTLGIVKPIVLGLSFGGFVAQAYATRYPKHAGGLILSSTAAKMEFGADAAPNRRDDPDAAARVVRRSAVSIYFGKNGGERERFDFRKALQKIACPTLVMVGDKDTITPVRFADEMMAHLKPDRAELAVFPGCGHGVHLDAPKKAFGVMRAFIARVAGAMP